MFFMNHFNVTFEHSKLKKKILFLHPYIIFKLTKHCRTRQLCMYITKLFNFSFNAIKSLQVSQKKKKKTAFLDLSQDTTIHISI